MKKYFFASIFLSAGIIVFASVSDIQYPVAELGNCADEAACMVYCDKPSNVNACIKFAEKNNLMSEEELGRAKNFIAAGAKGPGGCTGQKSCEEYCNDVSHIDECVSFAEKNNLIPPEELEEAKKVQTAVKRGVKPPPCGNKKQCDAYCAEPDHMEECITFGMEAGFIQGKELEDAQKMLQAVKKGVKPPPCKGKEACDEYCSKPDNMEMCMTFAMEAGFMSEEEKADARKMLQALKKGAKPPACKGKEECDAYCAEESHFEECLNFAEAAGFMNPEEAEMARKTGGKGPGGCKGKEECEIFCNNPENQETCFNFAKEHGLIPEEELQKMEEGKQQFQQAMQNMPPEVYSCLESAVGAETMAKFKSGEAMPSREIGDKMKECFEKNMPQMPPQPSQQQPVQCTGENCPSQIYPERVEGQGGGTGGGFMPQMTGPGGCASPEECQKYCESNPEECMKFMNFVPPTGGSTMSGGTAMPPMPPQPSQQQPVQCTGENCPSQMPMQQPMQPGMPLPPEGSVQMPEGYVPTPGMMPGFAPSAGGMPPPPLIAPAPESGGIQPEGIVPPAPYSGPMPPMEQQQFAPPPPPLESSPSSGLPPPSLAGIIFWPFIQLFGF